MSTTTTTRRNPQDRDSSTTGGATAVRHLRFPVDAWRRGAARARRDGVGVAEAAVMLFTAYADGELSLPGRPGPSPARGEGAGARPTVDLVDDEDRATHPPITSSSGAPADPAAPSPDGTVRRPGRRPNGSGKHTTRGFRISDDKWAAGLEAAHSLGVTLASRLVAAVDEVIDEATRAR